jgi:hypothetical protein
MKKFLSGLKIRVGNFKSNLKKQFNESKKEPKSKRKSFIIGLLTVIGIFGLTLVGPALSAVAKDLPPAAPKPSGPAPTPPAPALPPSKEIYGLAVSLAIRSGAFTIGVICGLIIVAVILHAEGK